MADVSENISFELDLDGAKPSQNIYRRRKSYAGPSTARVELGISMNCDLNGYQFSDFSEQYICREELPNGSNTFQQVLDEITEELETVHVISFEPKPVPVAPHPRRKSIATPRCSQPLQRNKSRKAVRWGNTTTVSMDEQKIPPLTRRRVFSDGAITGKRHPKE